MTFKSDNTTNSTSSKNNNDADFSKYTYETKSNNNNNQNNQNSNDIKESINSSLDQTKDQIKRSIEESRNQIPRYNEIVNNYQQQSLQTAKEISEEYIESQKAVINTLQSAWRPYSESYSNLVTIFASPDSMTKAYTKCVSNFADNAVSAIRLTNNIIFSNLDSWKAGLQQAKDNSKHLSNLNVNAARTFENNSRQIASTVSEATSNNNNGNNPNTATYSNTTTATAKKQ